MSLPSRDQVRTLTSRFLEAPGAKALLSVGLTPNVVTILGFCLTAAAAALVAVGFNIAAGLVFLTGALLDLMDGAMARVSGRASNFGALLDSVMDRLGEAALFLGIAVYGVRSDISEDRMTFFIVVLVLALATSQTVSYLRARGESLGVDTRAVLMTRPERVIILAAGLLFGLRALEVTLTIIAALSFVSMLQRFVKIKNILGGS